jgi:hypothetical protein
MASNLSRFRSWARLLRRERIVDRRTEITTEITVETDRVFVIRRRRSIRAWCPECGCAVEIRGESRCLAFCAGRACADLPLSLANTIPLLTRHESGVIVVSLEASSGLGENCHGGVESSGSQYS